MEHELANGVLLILAVGLVIGAWLALFYLVRHLARLLFPILYKAAVRNGTGPRSIH